MERIPESRRIEIVQLRRLGMSIPEIALQTSTARTTVTRYVSGVSIDAKHLKRLKEKQGGAKDRAKGLRENVLNEAQQMLGEMSGRDHLFLLLGLYWGEGTKRDFSLINSDPLLLQTLLVCLYKVGIRKERISLSLRVHSNISISEAKKFWAATTGLPLTRIGRVEVIEGKKKGKLPYGMCRVRVLSGIRERLLIQTAISLIGKDSSKKVVSQ